MVGENELVQHYWKFTECAHTHHRTSVMFRLKRRHCRCLQQYNTILQQQEQQQQQ